MCLFKDYNKRILSYDSYVSYTYNITAYGFTNIMSNDL